MRRSAVALNVLAALLCSCKREAQTIIRVDGSSTVFPISAAVAEEFHVQHRERVAVAISGTGGGFKKFCAGETDISDASRPITAAEVDLCTKNGIDYVELPVAHDGLVVVVNPKNDWAHDITVSELRKIWAPDAEGKVTRWSQVREGWSDRELHLFGAGFDSGTYDYFTEAIVGKEHESRRDFSSSEDDDELVRGVARDELALGFFGYAYYAKNEGELKLVAVDDERPENGAGPIAPSVESVRNATYQPLSRPIFVMSPRLRSLVRRSRASCSSISTAPRGWSKRWATSRCQSAHTRSGDNA